MTALNTFIQRNVPAVLRNTRDFIGPRGWVWIGNQLLRRLEAEGLVKLSQKKEIGVLVVNKYWITLPSDLRQVLTVCWPDSHKYRPIEDISYEIVNGKLKIYPAIDLDYDSVDTFTLSSGDTDSVVIDDDDAAENQWEDYLLVLTDGTYSGDNILIGEHDAASGGTTTLNFLHSRTTSISDSTAGYLTDQYVMLQYMATFTGMTAADDEIPVDDKFESALVNGFCYHAESPGNKRKKDFFDLFEYDLELLRNEEFTPTPDQARPTPRPMAGLESCSEFTGINHNDFVGDTDAWLE